MAIDLDAARAARKEGKGEPPEVIFGGATYTLPVEMPFEIVEQLALLQNANGDDASAAEPVLAVVHLLLGDQYEAFMANHPSMDDLTALAKGAMQEYGVGPGESQASRRSSNATPLLSKQISSGSTA